MRYYLQVGSVDWCCRTSQYVLDMECSGRCTESPTTAPSIAPTVAMPPSTSASTTTEEEEEDSDSNNSKVDGKTLTLIVSVNLSTFFVVLLCIALVLFMAYRKYSEAYKARLRKSDNNNNNNSNNMSQSSLGPGSSRAAGSGKKGKNKKKKKHKKGWSEGHATTIDPKNLNTEELDDDGEDGANAVRLQYAGVAVAGAAVRNNGTGEGTYAIPGSSMGESTQAHGEGGDGAAAAAAGVGQSGVIMEQVSLPPQPVMAQMTGSTAGGSEEYTGRVTSTAGANACTGQVTTVHTMDTLGTQRDRENSEDMYSDRTPGAPDDDDVDVMSDNEVVRPSEVQMAMGNTVGRN